MAKKRKTKTTQARKKRTRKKETKAKPRVKSKKVRNPQPKYLAVDEEFRADKEKVKDLNKRLEKGELKWGYYGTVDSKGVHFYQILNGHGN